MSLMCHEFVHLLSFHDLKHNKRLICYCLSSSMETCFRGKQSVCYLKSFWMLALQMSWYGLLCYDESFADYDFFSSMHAACDPSSWRYLAQGESWTGLERKCITLMTAIVWNNIELYCMTWTIMCLCPSMAWQYPIWSAAWIWMCCCQHRMCEIQTVLAFGTIFALMFPLIVLLYDLPCRWM